MEYSDTELMESEDRCLTMGSRDWVAFFTGLNLAFAVCYLMCKPSWDHPLSWRTRIGTGLLYLIVVLAVGALGTRITIPTASRQQFRTIFSAAMRGMIFMPATALFLRSESILAQVLAIASASLMAVYLSRRVAVAQHPAQSFGNMFANEVRLAPASLLAFVVSVLAYAAVTAVAVDRVVLATLLIAASSFLLVFRFSSGRMMRPLGRRARPYLSFALAFYLILIALSPSQHSAFRLAGLPGLGAHSGATPGPPDPRASGLGYRTIVLWPPQKREPVMIAPPAAATPGSVKIAKPMVIPFFGPYWYFKYPGELPGPNTRTSHGDPLLANVRSTDSNPLLMEAHQHLDEPISLSCCSEIRIVFKNDASAGALAVGITLIDSQQPGRLTQSLGVKVVPGRSLSAQMSDPPVEETLTFRLPKECVLQSFNDINVTFMPDPRRQTSGRKVAIERFILMPN